MKYGFKACQWDASLLQSSFLHLNNYYMKTNDDVPTGLSWPQVRRWREPRAGRRPTFGVHAFDEACPDPEGNPRLLGGRLFAHQRRAYGGSE